MDILSVVNGLRFVDTFFPSGAYAFSSGLEAAVQNGAVRNVTDFVKYVHDFLKASVIQRDGVAVARAWNAQARGVPSEAVAADRELEAMTLCYETRMASRQMGRQVIRIAVEEPQTSSTLRKFHSMVNGGTTPGHFPVCLGLVLGSNGWTREATVAAFLYQITVGFVSAGMKLLPLGQREGQRLLGLWAPEIARAAGVSDPQAAMRSWSPVQDIHAMRHSRLESRLFRS